MSLFRCEECGVVDSTAISNREFMNTYYGEQWPDSPRRHKLMTGRWACYECRNGEWHGRFEKTKWNPSIKIINN